MAAGTTLQIKRKATPFVALDLAIGELGLDTSTGDLYASLDGLTVFIIAASAIADAVADYLPLAGGTMIGDIDMGSFDIKGALNIYADTYYSGSPATPIAAVLGMGADFQAADASNINRVYAAYLRGVLEDGASVTAVDPTLRQLRANDGTTIVLNWAIPGYLDTDGVGIRTAGDGYFANWNGVDYVLSLDWVNRALYGTDGTTMAFRWDNTTGDIMNSAGTSSINVNNGTLTDSNSGAVQWLGHKLTNTGAISGVYGDALNWNTRQLLGSDGTTVALDWSNGTARFASDGGSGYYYWIDGAGFNSPSGSWNGGTFTGVQDFTNGLTLPVGQTIQTNAPGTYGPTGFQFNDGGIALNNGGNGGLNLNNYPLVTGGNIYAANFSGGSIGSPSAAELPSGANAGSDLFFTAGRVLEADDIHSIGGFYSGANYGTPSAALFPYGLSSSGDADFGNYQIKTYDGVGLAYMAAGKLFTRTGAEVLDFTENAYTGAYMGRGAAFGANVYMNGYDIQNIETLDVDTIRNQVGTGAPTFTYGLVATGKVSNTKIDITLGAADTTFAVTNNFVNLAGDAGANTIATITGGVSGQDLTILFVDGLVTLTNDNTATADTLDLAAPFVGTARATIKFIHDGTKWIETSRSQETPALRLWNPDTSSYYVLTISGSATNEILSYTPE